MNRGQETKCLDIVYPFLSDGNDDELKYSLRSLQNMPHHKVWVVGNKPRFDTQNLNVVKVKQTKTDTAQEPYLDVNNKLIKICKDKRLSDDFILFNDDFFVVDKIDRLRPAYCGTVQGLINQKMQGSQGNKVYAMLLQNDAGQHASELKNYELHLPMIMNKQKLLDLLEDRPSSCLRRSVYGNVYYQDISIEYPKDVKVYSDEAIRPLVCPFVSTASGNFKDSPVANYIRGLFPNKSVYEI